MIKDNIVLGVKVVTSRDYWEGLVVGFNKKTNSVIILNSLWGVKEMDSQNFKKLGDIDSKFVKVTQDKVLKKKIYSSANSEFELFISLPMSLVEVKD